MDTGAAVTAWLRRLNDGDAAGVQPLWEHYFERLVRLARKKLAGVPRRIADEEDVALSAFHRRSPARTSPRKWRKNVSGCWNRSATITYGRLR